MKPPIATEPPHLLDDATIQRYIVDGHIAVRPTLPADYHPALNAQLAAPSSAPAIPATIS